MFDIGMIGVEVSSRGQGVATNLIRRSILLAGCLGFRAIKAEATNRFARNTFMTVRANYSIHGIHGIPRLESLKPASTGSMLGETFMLLGETLD